MSIAVFYTNQIVTWFGNTKLKSYFLNIKKVKRYKMFDIRSYIFS